MSTKKQYFRDVKPGEVSIEGRQSNGVTADNKGNVFIYSGLKDTELDFLSETQNKDNIPLYYGNSYVAITKSQTHSTLALGNNNYETLIDKTDANKIVTTDNNTKFPKVKAILIGDSQTPYVDKNSTQSSRLTDKGGKSSLWEGGKGVSWLIEALTEYSGDPEVTHVVTVIGTNGGFGKFAKDDIPKLFSLIKTKFPKAVVLTVQGSWGWGGLKNITEKEVRDYYKQYEKQGAILVEPPIGAIEPHGDKPVYKLIGKQIDEIISKNVVPTVTATPTPQVATPPQQEEKLPTAAPPPDDEQIDEFVFLEDQEFELAPTQLTDQIARHVDDYTQEYIDALNDPNDVKRAPAKKTELPPITTSDKTEFTLVYLGHNQGPAGVKAVLYYSFVEPSQKVPTKNKFTSANINGNMYGFRLNGTKYVTTTYAKWSTNVGDDFNKTFGKDIETSYTPGNFFTYWASYKIPQKIAQGKKNIPKDLYDLFSNLSGEYDVPLDYIIATAYIESGFKPKAGNSKYKGMFALSQSEFNKYYPSGDIFNTEQNSRAGVQVLKERVKEAKTLFNQYKSYFK